MIGLFGFDFWLTNMMNNRNNVFCFVTLMQILQSLSCTTNQITDLMVEYLFLSAERFGTVRFRHGINRSLPKQQL